MIYKARGGADIVLFDFDCGGEKPLVGVYKAQDGLWFAAQWSPLGHFNVNNHKYASSDLDILNPPRFEKLSFNDEVA